MKKSIIISTIIAISIISAIIYFAYFPYRPKCNPWRNITGYTALCAELNSVRNCSQMYCKGNGNYQIKNKSLLENSSGSYFLFASNQIIDIALQNQIITQANFWANANTPASYSVSSITFIPNIVTSSGTITYAGIDIRVQYKNCTTIKLPEN